MEQILAYIESHGLPVFIIASCIIAIIGVLKLCNIFKKIDSADVKKCVYYALDIVLSCAFVAIYFAIFNVAWSGYLMFSVAQIGATTTLYAIYENLGLRKLVRAFIAYLKKSVANKDSKLTKLINKMGLEKAVQEFQSVVETEKKKQEEAKLQSVNTTAAQATVTQVANDITKLNK